MKISSRIRYYYPNTYEVKDFDTFDEAITALVQSGLDGRMDFRTVQYDDTKQYAICLSDRSHQKARDILSKFFERKDIWPTTR